VFEIERDPDPRRQQLVVTNLSRRFTVTGDGQMLVLTVPEARALVEVLMTETMSVNFDVYDHGDEDA